MEDDHGLNLTLSLKCPPNSRPLHNTNNPPPVPPPSQFLLSLPPCPYRLIPSPFNSFPHNHQIIPPPNYKPPSHAEMDKEIAAYIEEKRRQAAVAVKERVVEEEVVVSSPPLSHSTVSTTSLSGNKRSVERGGENYEADRDLSPNYVVVSEEEDGGDTAARKKLRLTKEQAAVLEEAFKVHNTLSTKQKVALAKQLDLRPRQVEVWFQNRRARTKLKQTEVDCRYLKRYCQTLTEENKRLQKELTELRVLKLSPMAYMNKVPPTTLVVCAQCVRETACSSSSSSTQASSAGGTNINHPKATSAIPFTKLISPDALGIRRSQP